MWKISFKSLWAHKRRLIRTCSAVLLGVAFLAGTLVLGDTMRAGFAGAFEDAYSSTDVTVQGAETIGSESTEQRRLVPDEVLDQVRSVDGVSVAEPSIDGLAQVTGSDGEAVGGSGPPTLGGNWVDGAQNPYSVVEGRATEAHDEVVIDRGTADAGQLAVGDPTKVRTPTHIDATIVGIVAFGSQDSIGGAGYTGFTLDDAREYLLGGAPGYTSISVNAVPGVSDAQLAERVTAVLPAGIEARTSAQMTAAATESIGEDFLDAFEMILLVFTGVALLVSTFSIYNTFSVILAQRARESALFRAIGATRGQVLGSIGIEALMVGLVASLGGLVVGLGLAVGLSQLMKGIGMDLPGGLTISANSVIVSIIVGLVVTLLASLAPAIRASRIPPLAALRDAAINRSDTSRARTVLGAVLTAGGVGLVLYGALADLDSPLGIVGLGAVLSIIGVVVLGPIVARPASQLLGWPVAALRGSSGSLARGNAMRNPRRTSGTASALMIGVAVVALFTVVAASLTTMVRDTVAGAITADLIIVDSGFSGSGMSPDMTDALAALPQVETAVGLGFGTALLNGEEEDLTVVDQSTLDTVLDSDVQQGSISDMSDDQLAVSTNEAEDNGWKLGSPIRVAFVDGSEVRMTVGAIYDESDLTGSIVMPRQTWASHNTLNVDFVQAVDLAPGVSIDEGREAVATVSKEFGAPEPQTRSEYADDVAGRITGLLNIVYAMLALSIVIALMGIANTLALSIHERTRELGLLRAIGQTRGQLRSMVRWESVIIAVFGTVGGIGLGLFLAWGLVTGIVASGDGAPFTTPVGLLATITVIGGLAGVLAGILPARRAARLDVLEAISTE
ncbi:ABC transporter permease [soil metagenome]